MVAPNSEVMGQAGQVGGDREREVVDHWWPKKVSCSERDGLAMQRCRRVFWGAGTVKQWDILSSAHFSTQQLPSFKKSVRLPWWFSG